MVNHNDVKRKKKHKVKSGIETCRVEECNKSQREEACHAKLHCEEVQDVGNNNDVKRKKKKHKHQVKSVLETCKDKESKDDQRKEVDDIKLLGEKVQDVVKNNDVNRKKRRHKKKVESGIATCGGEDCNKDQREADNVELQGEEVQDVVNDNDVKRKKKSHKDGDGDKYQSGMQTCIDDECTRIILDKDVQSELPLPESIPMRNILGIEMLPEDAGNALQFVEFCSSFGKVLNLKRAHAESILGELLCRPSRRLGRPGKYSLVVRFLFQLLSLLQEDMGEKPSSIDDTKNKPSWFQDLGKCISNSEAKHLLKELPEDCYSKGAAGYDILNISQKLRILAYLCDEVICTSKLRTWIEEHEKIAESEKEAKGKVNTARDKVKHLKQKLQDEAAKLIMTKNGALLSISGHETLSQLNTETDQAHAQLVEAKGVMAAQKQRCDALRTEPYCVDVDGRVFWRLKGYNNGKDIVLQDTGSWDANVSKEEWFVFGAESKEAIEKYLLQGENKP